MYRLNHENKKSSLSYAPTFYKSYEENKTFSHIYELYSIFFMEIVQNELYAKWGRFLSHGDIGRSLGDRYLGFVLLEPTCLFYLLTWKGNLLPPPNNLLPAPWEF